MKIVLFCFCVLTMSLFALSQLFSGGQKNFRIKDALKNMKLRSLIKVHGTHRKKMAAPIEADELKASVFGIEILSVFTVY